MNSPNPERTQDYRGDGDYVPPPMASDPGGLPEPAPTSAGADLRGLGHELRELVHDHIELATLETRLAVSTVLRMTIVAIVMAVVIVSGWLALLGAAALAMVSIGLAPFVAMLLLVPLNLLLAGIGWLLLWHQCRTLGWPATQRLIKSPPGSEQPGVSHAAP